MCVCVCNSEKLEMDQGGGALPWQQWIHNEHQIKQKFTNIHSRGNFELNC